MLYLFVVFVSYFLLCMYRLRGEDDVMNRHTLPPMAMTIVERYAAMGVPLRYAIYSIYIVDLMIYLLYLIIYLLRYIANFYFMGTTVLLFWRRKNVF